jgi:hypothetical protein
MGDPANQRLSDRAQLEKARKAFMADFGDGFSGKAPVARQDDWSPAAEAESMGDGGKFAVLDRLAESDPRAFENAIGRLSREDQDRYGL